MSSRSLDIRKAMAARTSLLVAAYSLDLTKPLDINVFSDFSISPTTGSYVLLVEVTSEKSHVRIFPDIWCNYEVCSWYNEEGERR